MISFLFFLSRSRFVFIRWNYFHFDPLTLWYRRYVNNKDNFGKKLFFDWFLVTVRDSWEKILFTLYISSKMCLFKEASANWRVSEFQNKYVFKFFFIKKKYIYMHILQIINIFNLLWNHFVISLSRCHINWLREYSNFFKTLLICAREIYFLKSV